MSWSMLPLIFAAAIAAEAPNAPGLSAVGGLAGCWKVAGQVRGKDAASIARGEWRLGGRYFMLHLRQVTQQPYEAAITYGAGEKPEAIGSFWMDTFGGLYEPSLGLGATSPGGFTLSYRFPDALYVNRFERQGEGWRWTIVEQAPGKPDKTFADYSLTPIDCRGMRFGF
jgi:hypothetical protein